MNPLNCSGRPSWHKNNNEKAGLLILHVCGGDFFFFLTRILSSSLPFFISVSFPVGMSTDALHSVLKFLSTDLSKYAAFRALPPRCLLLTGPPGVGKTHAVRTAAFQLNLHVVSLSSSSSPSSLRHELGSPSRPCVLFIDELDIVCPADSSRTSNASTLSRASAPHMSLLLSLLDSSFAFGRTSSLYIVAATNRPHAIHPSLRRAGRFDTEIALGPPSLSDRHLILKSVQPSLNPSVISYIAERTSAYVPADLVSLCATASRIAAPSAPSLADFTRAISISTPSVLRTQLAITPASCSWDDIVGADAVKRRLQLAVEWPMRYSSTFKRLCVKPPRGILLHGPPGCSKTTLVKAAASHALSAFMRVTPADIYSMYVGEAERILRDAFTIAKSASPCILFLDEVDAIVGNRARGSNENTPVQQRVLSTMLTEMDGVVSAGGVLVVGATNRLELLDDALLRPGRFDEIINVPLPDEKDRLAILKMYTKMLNLGPDVDLGYIAEKTEGKSGAHLKGMCSEAALACLRDYQRLMKKGSGEEGSVEKDHLAVTMKHFAIDGPT